MEDRLKERLTGAVILVAVVVILVPEMFRGTGPAPAAAVAPAVEVKIQEASTRALTDAAVAPTATPVPAAVVPSAATPEAPPAQPAALLPSTPTVAPAAATDPLVPAAPPATIAPPAPAGTGGWVVQVGSFTVRDNAARMVRQAARKGLKLQVAGPDDRGYYRVRSGIQHERAAAAALQIRYRAQGFDGVVRQAP